VNTLGLALAVAALFVEAAQGGELEELLAAAEEQANLSVPLRADIEARSEHVEGERTERIVLLERRSPSGRGSDLYVQLEAAGLRYLVLGDGSAWVSDGGRIRPASLDTGIASTSWTLEDLLPFSTARCDLPRTVEIMPGYLTLLCDPKPEHRRQYVLWVYKFDRAKAVPERVLYYRERQDNLVKMLRSEQFQLVGRKWRPGRMVMQDFKLRTRDVFDLRWSQDPSFPPETFDPGGFAEVSLAPRPRARTE
jgi:hypothetical protein